jgi:hypothetical protein
VNSWFHLLRTVERFGLVFTLSLTTVRPAALPIRANHVSGGLLMIHEITELERHMLA